MFDRFTDRVRKLLELAKQEALRFDNKSVDTEHILLALLEEGSGVGFTVLKNLVDIKDLRIKIEKQITTKPVKAANCRKTFTPATKQVFQYAIEEARSLKDNIVGTQHLLLSLLLEPDGVAAAALADCGLNYEQVRSEVIKISGKNPEEGKS